MIIETIEDYNIFKETAKKYQVFEFKCTGCGKIVSKQFRKSREFNCLCRSCSVKKTSIQNWGVDSPFKSDEIKDKIKKTNIEKYGVDYALQADSVKEKIKQTNLEKYGTENVFASEYCKQKIKETMQEKYGIDYALQNPEFFEKMKNTTLRKYGVEFASQNIDIQEKIKDSNLEKFGVPYAAQSNEVKEKIKKTNLEKYGFEFACNNPEVQEKISDTQRCNFENKEIADEILNRRKRTNLEKYGYSYASQSPEIKEKAKQTCIEKYGVGHTIRSTYIFNDVQFDSSWELAFYVYNLETGKNIERCTKSFEYEYNGQIHNYYPDFRIDELLFEIKGDQFFNKNGQMICPYDNNLNGLYESKHQCGLKNNVIFLRQIDIKPCIDYMFQNYGLKWKEIFRLE